MHVVVTGGTGTIFREAPMRVPSVDENYASGAWSPSRFIATYGVTMETMDETEAIPDWAAIVAVIGTVLAVGGLVSVLVSEGLVAFLVLIVGLVLVASGLIAAEESIGKEG
jgi:hypothetical protein